MQYLNELVVLDSACQLNRAHKDKLIITGAPGTLAAGRCALEVAPRLIVFNDAGVGKNQAGIAALAQLERFGIAAAAVAAASARIGDAEDTLACGVISFVNAQAAQLGLAVGAPLAQALCPLVDAALLPEARR